MNDVEKAQMELQTPNVIMDATIYKVEQILNQHFPDYISFGGGSYTISRGSTQVMIVIRPYTKEEAAIEFVANVVYGANINEELMRYLLLQNNELHFGAFGLLFDETITFSHTISGSIITGEEFKTVLNSVATIADFYDDIIVNMVGGKRALDYYQDLENQ